jgi:hypothetical protein
MRSRLAGGRTPPPAADVSYQDARYVLPEGTTNYIMLEYPLREFINVYAYRGCAMFQWEIVSVMRACREILVGAYPFLEPYVKISCEKTHGAKDAGVRVTCPTCGGDGGDLDDSSKVCDECNGAGTISDPQSIAHTCTFQGWESVEGQCPFPWARESNRSFRSEHHRIERK